MKYRDKFTADINGLEQVDQAREIAHLKRWVRRVSRRSTEDLLCRGITKFIDLNLLKYVCGAEGGVHSGFTAVRESPELRAFIGDVLWPKKPAAGALLDLLAQGKVIMETGYRRGVPEFIFCAVDDQTDREPDAVRKCRRRAQR